MYLTELVSLLELLNFSLSKKCIRQPQGGICQNDSTSEAQSMNSNYLRYIWAFYRQRPLSGWVLCNIMCLYRLLLFPLCILITLAIFSPPNSYEQNFNYTYSWVRNAHPCFCEPCIRALKRRLGATERQAGVCAGDGTGTHWHSWIREGSAASTDTICKGFTASKGCIVMRYTPQGVFHADLCGAGLRLQSRVVFPGCPSWDLMHEHWWEDDQRAEEQPFSARSTSFLFLLCEKKNNSKKISVGTQKYHGQNSTSVALHYTIPVPPRILQSSLHNPRTTDL